MINGIVSKSRDNFITISATSDVTIYLNNANTAIGANSSGEIVSALNIVSAEWSAANGAYWKVTRGANTVLLLTEGQHSFDFIDGKPIDYVGGEPFENINIEKINSGPASIIIKARKTTRLPDPQNLYYGGDMIYWGSDELYWGL